MAELFYASDRNVWRAYLEEHFQTQKEIWFVFPMQGSGEEAISYNDAVEEALCFGWIDSTNKRLDSLHNARRFTPRRKGSPYSQPNIERLIWLDGQGMIHPSVRKEVLPLLENEFVFPKDILAALQADPQTWANYQSFSPSYQRIRVAYIEAARKRPEEFQKRLKTFVAKTHDGKKIIGYGGIDKYY